MVVCVCVCVCVCLGARAQTQKQKPHYSHYINSGKKRGKQLEAIFLVVFSQFPYNQNVSHVYQDTNNKRVANFIL
jgi:hypothetical protein